MEELVEMIAIIDTKNNACKREKSFKTVLSILFYILEHQRHFAIYCGKTREYANQYSPDFINVQFL
jgi:predicted GIY-YIG superfamily endonuclease